MTEATRKDLVPLGRNGQYNILWSARFASELGSELAFLGFPLLVIATSGSAWELGVVTAVFSAAQMIAMLPAGILADRWNRARLMITCEIMRFVAISSLAVAIALDSYEFWHLAVVAALEGGLAAVFAPAEDAVLPRLVPTPQLGAAIARNTSRTYIATLLGPALGGILFAVDRLLPFTVDAVLLIASAFVLLFLRVPAVSVGSTAELNDEELDASDPVGRGRQLFDDLVGGWRWVVGHRQIRTTMIWIFATQFVFSALLIVVLARAGEENTTPGEIGLMMTCYGVGGLLGSLAAEAIHSRIPAGTTVVWFSWIVIVPVAVMSVMPPGIPLGVTLGLVGLCVPAAFTSIVTYQLTNTPDHLRGRLSSVSGAIVGLAGTLGPLTAGAIVASGIGVDPILVLSGALLVVAVFATSNRSMRNLASH